MEEDNEVTVILVAPCRQGLPQESVRVELSTRYGRRTLSESDEQDIEVVWQDRLRGNPRIFDAPKFRFSGAEVDSAGLLGIRLGLTGYRDYLGTNLAPGEKPAHLRRWGLTVCDDPQAYLADPLGVGAVLCTRDNRLVLLHRSHSVAEAQGLLDVPGGHPEPLVANDALVDKLCVEDLQPELVVQEIFHSVLAEIRDEVNLPIQCLSTPWLMGIVRNWTSMGRPSAEFFVRCDLSSEEILQHYQQGGVEAHESTDIMFIDREEGCHSLRPNGA
uniref:uridine diphosphate glucose pyrophosphatase NUDT22 isoform X2 n=1 Tax=Myxine glutinosa TaxID=7769 RepID=UPI00358F2690